MTQYKCDRCGRTITNNATGCMYSDNQPIIDPEANYHIRLTRPYGQPRDIDLCGECFMALDKWLFPNKGLVNVDKT